jgi:hypothetical protein
VVTSIASHPSGKRWRCDAHAERVAEFGDLKGEVNGDVPADD